MTTASSANTLRRSLLIKLISKPAPSREDMASVIELTASKVVEALQAQSLTLYLVEGNEIVFRHVYYSPSLWDTNKALEAKFKETAAKLNNLRLPAGKGIVGKVIADGKEIFFRNTQTQAPMMASMTQNTGFEVFSMLTVPLKAGNVVIGAIQVLNKEPVSGTNSQFTDSDLPLLVEVAEYSASLIQRMLDPKHQLSADDTAKFIARLTNHPLVTKIDEIPIDEKLVEAIGDAIIRREGIFPTKRISPSSIAVLMANPLDYAKREAFQQATELVSEAILVASEPERSPQATSKARTPRPSSSSPTASSRTPTSAAHPISTSSRRKKTSSSATASTVSARKSSVCPGRSPTASSRASRSCATSTSPNAGCRRTDASSSKNTPRRTSTSTCASPPAP